ncbi:MarR family winged helix-turn-helix transcriptional regulator [Paenibacillus lemnae]|uniref:MarR family transcriptional regulator n=1 Tax=Paenibacillus lemnae TaxID=1330551 RepID=A0A848M9K2_PAELE|nr:MarR family transcriptional regulator [Paenibacillus lemnae]NMO96573.1 MarR family transcriptional regulator [Paenibacillus lemnae]
MEGETIEELLQDCLYFTVKKMDRLLDKLAEESFRSTGLSPTYGFMMVAVNEKNGITQKELGELLHIAPSTITRFIEKLQYKNLVYSEHIGRMTHIFPTEQGKAILGDIRKAWDELYDKYSAVLGEEHGEELTASMYKAGDMLDEGMNRKS